MGTRLIYNQFFALLTKAKRKFLHLDVIFKNNVRLYGGIDHMKLLKVPMRIFTCNTMEPRQQMDQARLKLAILINFKILGAQRLMSNNWCNQFPQSPILFNHNIKMQITNKITKNSIRIRFKIRNITTINYTTINVL